MMASLTLGTRITDIGRDSYLVGRWLIDSGASNHFTANRNILQNFQFIPPERIRTGNGAIIAYGIGDVTIDLPYGRTTIQ